MKYHDNVSSFSFSRQYRQQENDKNSTSVVRLQSTSYKGRQAGGFSYAQRNNGHAGQIMESIQR